MTTATPATLRNLLTAEVDTPAGQYPLDVTNIRVSIDEDRTAYVQAQITVTWVTPEIWALIDPRAGNYIRWRVSQYGDVAMTQWIGDLPGERLVGSDGYARMVIRTVARDYSTRQVTISCESRESMLADKIRNAGTTINTGATNVADLVEWSLNDVFGSTGTVAWVSTMAATSIPSGDRRIMQQGDTHFDLMRPELDAIGVRIYDLWGQLWGSSLRNTVSARPPLQLATYDWADGASFETDPIVHGLTESITRNGDWADGVLIKYDQTASGGSVSYQASGAGVNTKGVMITRYRPAPSSNAADALVTRAEQRGEDITIVCRARVTEVHTRGPIEIHTREDGVISAVIRSVEWDFFAGSMTINAQTGTEL